MGLGETQVKRIVEITDAKNLRRMGLQIGNVQFDTWRDIIGVDMKMFSRPVASENRWTVGSCETAPV